VCVRILAKILRHANHVFSAYIIVAFVTCLALPYFHINSHTVLFLFPGGGGTD